MDDNTQNNQIFGGGGPEPADGPPESFPHPMPPNNAPSGGPPIGGAGGSGGPTDPIGAFGMPPGTTNPHQQPMPIERPPEGLPPIGSSASSNNSGWQFGGAMGTPSGGSANPGPIIASGQPDANTTDGTAGGTDNSGNPRFPGGKDPFGPPVRPPDNLPPIGGSQPGNGSGFQFGGASGGGGQASADSGTKIGLSNSGQVSPIDNPPPQSGGLNSPLHAMPPNRMPGAGPTAMGGSDNGLLNPIDPIDMHHPQSPQGDSGGSQFGGGVAYGGGTPGSGVDNSLYGTDGTPIGGDPFSGPGHKV